MILAVALLLSLAVPMTPAALSTPSPGTGTSDTQNHEQSQMYRAYVTTVVQNGASVIVSTIALTGCRDGRAQCAALIQDASTQVSQMQSELASTPAPDCLASADAKLQDALAFQKSGLTIAESAVKSDSWLRLIQGALMTTAGAWRAGQAVAAAREADC
jgi:hypothetical protein